MAISATLELREVKTSFEKFVATAIKSYSVIDLDYTLTRSFDKTSRPTSNVSMDFIKVTIRGTKEVFAPFHKWISKPDNTMQGIIKIFDSTGLISSTFKDTTGGDAPVELDDVSSLAQDELEDSVNYAMDDASYYGTNNSDIYDEMSREDMISYIASKDLPIKVEKNDTDVIIKKKIRAYNKYCKSLEDMTLDKLKEEADKIKPAPAIPEKATDEEKKKIYKEALKNNYKTPEYSYAEQLDEIGRKDKNKFLDKMKSSTSKTISSIGGAAVRTFESARSITFEDAYCVSLREHFKADPNHQGPVDSSYPWILEIGIKPGKVLVNGYNAMGGAGVDDIQFDFFTL